MIITLALDDDDMPEGPILRDEGTVLVLQGRNSRGKIVAFGVDYRPAQRILFGLEGDGEVEVEIEPWMVLGRI
jgi:hypothetical protein